MVEIVGVLVVVVEATVVLVLVDEVVVVVDEQPGHPVDDRISQAARGPVPDGRHTMLPRLGNRKSPALFARRQHLHPRLLQHMVFGFVVDVAVESHRVGDAEQLGVIDQPLLPPATAEDV